MRAYTACGSFNVDNVTVHSLIFQFGLNISIFGKVQFGYWYFILHIYTFFSPNWDSIACFCWCESLIKRQGTKVKHTCNIGGSLESS
jgi:hypothetical protein